MFMNNSIIPNKLLFNGLIDLNITLNKYNLYQECPLYLNIINNKNNFNAYPVDQSGGMRGGDSHLFKILRKIKIKLIF